MLQGLRTTARSAVAIVLCSAVIATTGCTPQQQANAKVAVAKMITYEPEVQTAVDTVASVVATLVPADAFLVSTAQQGFDVALGAFDVAARAYIATPNAGTLASVNTALQTLLTLNADQFLAAAHISNPASVALAKTAIASVREVLLLMDGMLTPALPRPTIAANAQARTLKVAEVAPWIDAAHRHEVELATGHRFGQVEAYETAQGF